MMAIASTASADLIMTEIMYNPGSQPDIAWEYIEFFNSDPINPVNLAGYVIDDQNGVAHIAANIVSGIVPPHGTAVIFNIDSNSAANFMAAWGAGINVVGATGWSDMALGNGGDRIGIWDSFASYEGDHEIHDHAIVTIEYDDTAPWPVDDGEASIHLLDFAAPANEGSNWSRSADGVAGAYTSNPAGTDSTTNVGSPGLALAASDPVCGNGTCEVGEDADNCSRDCGTKMLGVSLPAWSYEDLLPTGPVTDSLSYLATSTKLNTVEVVVSWYMDAGPNQVARRCDPSDPSCMYGTSPDQKVYGTPPDADIISLIRAAEARNWTVILKPHVELVDPTSGEILARKYIGDPHQPSPGTVWFSDPTKVDDWFNAYYYTDPDSLLRTYAQIAQDEDVDILCVGTELKGMTELYPGRWENVVSAVGQGYSIDRLTYAADWDEYESVTFWELLDVIGIDAYFPLDIASSSPPQSELEDAWSTHISDVETFLYNHPGKHVFFTEIGYRATQGAHQDPWAVPGEEDVSDLDLQKRCYDASLARWQDLDWFDGMVFWSWSPDLSKDIGDNTRDEQYRTYGFCPYDKPAARSLGMNPANPQTCSETTMSTGQSYDLGVDIAPDIESASFSANWDSGDVDLTLMTPSGVLIDMPASRRGLEVQHSQTATHESYHVLSPEPGEWIMMVYAISSPPEGTYVILTAHSTTPPEAIPTVSEWGMVMMTLLVLPAGTVVLMRRASILNR